MSAGDDLGSDRLRVLLEKIAATAGDPPEHGLDRVATLRRRRKRHRRGAVAATMALAVSGVLGVALVRSLSEREHDVSATERERDADDPVPEMPDALTVRCSSAGIDVPVASIRPRGDGLHLEVENGGDRPVEVWIEGEAQDWDSGPLEVEPGDETIVQPVPPGVLTVGCRAGSGTDEQRRVELVDVDRLYTAPELACGDDVVEIADPEPLAEPVASFAEAAQAVLSEHLDGSEQVRSLAAYPDERLADRPHDPVVRVLRDREAVAFVYLEPDERDGRWAGATHVTACSDLLAPSDDDGGDRSTDDEGGEPDGE